MSVEQISVGRSRSPGAPLFQAALQFREEANTRSQLEISREKVALKKITVRIIGARSESGLIEEFIFFLH
jgi:hypothetical protein